MDPKRNKNNIFKGMTDIELYAYVKKKREEREKEKEKKQDRQNNIIDKSETANVKPKSDLPSAFDITTARKRTIDYECRYKNKKIVNSLVAELNKEIERASGDGKDNYIMQYSYARLGFDDETDIELILNTVRDIYVVAGYEFAFANQLIKNEQELTRDEFKQIDRYGSAVEFMISWKKPL